MDYLIFLGFFLAGIILLFVGFFVGKNADKDWRDQAQYYPVSILKFLVLSYVSLGLYGVFWFYKNFQWIKERDKSSAWPFWRGVFGGIWYFSLINNVRKNSSFQISMGAAIALAVIYFLLNMATNQYALRGDFPVPLIIGIVLDIGFVLPLLPLVAGINRFNGDSSQAFRKNSRFGPVAILAILIGGPLGIVETGYTINAIPVDKIYTADYLWEKDIDFMKEVAFFEDDEELISFYSGALLSIKESGNILTNKKLFIYQQGEDENLEEFFYYFKDIVEIEVEYGSSYLDDSIVTVWDSYGDGFYFILPGKQKTAEKFVSKLENLTGLKASAPL